MSTHKRMVYVFENATLCQVQLPAYFAVSALTREEAVSKLTAAFNVDPANPCVCELYCKPFTLFKAKTIKFAMMRTKINKDHWSILHGIHVVHRPACMRDSDCSLCVDESDGEFDFSKCWHSQRIIFPKTRIKSNV